MRGEPDHRGEGNDERSGLRERQAVTSFFTSVHHLFPFCL